MTKITMDLRGLTPSEPTMRPLYGMLLEDLGYEHAAASGAPGRCVVRIRRRAWA